MENAYNKCLIWLKLLWKRCVKMQSLKFLIDDFKGWSKLDYAWLFIACLSIIGITLMMGGSTISIISAIANVVCVILVAQGKLSNYVWGTVGVITYAYLAFTWGGILVRHSLMRYTIYQCSLLDSISGLKIHKILITLKHER